MRVRMVTRIITTTADLLVSFFASRPIYLFLRLRVYSRMEAVNIATRKGAKKTASISRVETSFRE